jgi:hypothetical protein
MIHFTFLAGPQWFCELSVVRSASIHNRTPLRLSEQPRCPGRARHGAGCSLRFDATLWPRRRNVR